MSFTAQLSKALFYSSKITLVCFDRTPSTRTDVINVTYPRAANLCIVVLLENGQKVGFVDQEISIYENGYFSIKDDRNMSYGITLNVDHPLTSKDILNEELQPLKETKDSEEKLYGISDSPADLSEYYKLEEQLSLVCTTLGLDYTKTKIHGAMLAFKERKIKNQYSALRILSLTKSATKRRDVYGLLLSYDDIDPEATIMRPCTNQEYSEWLNQPV